jgi:ABC-type spermidine/putrescine transport system permease subunit II
MIFFNTPVITPGFIKSFKISVVTSFADFLSNFFASGNGNVEIKLFKKSGMVSNMEFSLPFDLERKVVMSS